MQPERIERAVTHFVAVATLPSTENPIARERQRHSVEKPPAGIGLRTELDVMELVLAPTRPSPTILIVGGRLERVELLGGGQKSVENRFVMVFT